MAISQIRAIVKAVPGATTLLAPAIWTYRCIRTTRTARAFQRFREHCKFIGQNIASPTFVKVGANDGVTEDPCSDILLADKSWSGLLIEPVPYCVERLRQNFADEHRFTILQTAIGPNEGHAHFYYVDQNARRDQPDMPAWYDQLGSFDRQHITRHLSGALEPYIVEATIDVAPLSSVLRSHGVRKIDLLHIDTEGYDFEVLLTLDFREWMPALIYIEHKHLSDSSKRAMRRFLRKRGYTVENCGTDYSAWNSSLLRIITDHARRTTHAEANR